MTESSWSFEIGGICLTLVGPADWIAPFSQAWPTWGCESPSETIHLVQDPALPPADAAFFAARPRFVGGRCVLEARGFAGEIPPDGPACLRAHPAAELGDIDYFVRTVLALQAFDRGALLFHAAGIVHRGAAYAFFGHSGSGKTTAARLSAGKPVLNDDLILLRLGTGPCPGAGGGWEALATPFGKRRMREVRSAPLRALLRLTQAAGEGLEPLSQGAALGELLANTPVVNADPARIPALLTRWEEITRALPVYSLRFRKSNAFWEVLDAQLG